MKLNIIVVSLVSVAVNLPTLGLPTDQEPDALSPLIVQVPLPLAEVLPVS